MRRPELVRLRKRMKARPQDFPRIGPEEFDCYCVNWAIDKADARTPGIYGAAAHVMGLLIAEILRLRQEKRAMRRAVHAAARSVLIPHVIRALAQAALDKERGDDHV